MQRQHLLSFLMRLDMTCFKNKNKTKHHELFRSYWLVGRSKQACLTFETFSLSSLLAAMKATVWRDGEREREGESVPSQAKSEYFVINPFRLLMEPLKDILALSLSCIIYVLTKNTSVDLSTEYEIINLSAGDVVSAGKLNSSHSSLIYVYLLRLIVSHSMKVHNYRRDSPLPITLLLI